VDLSHILLPVDFSAHGRAVADYVGAMARGSRSRLTLLHVLECPPSWYSDVDTELLSSLVDLALVKEQRKEQLNSYLEREFHDLAPLRLLSQGDPATEIVQFANREKVGLIMIPTRGCGIWRRLLLGSVTAKVLHDATCPVWTSSHSEHVAPARYPYRTIACAVDLSERSKEAIRWASELATEHNAEMYVVHAIDENEESTNRGVLALRSYLRVNAVDKWQRLQQELSLNAPLHISYGSVGAAVRKAAHDLQADVVIINRGDCKQALGRLRANTYAVVRESPCPVISV
jgi:nucleotide-binding universal stress UspA family protein